MYVVCHHEFKCRAVWCYRIHIANYPNFTHEIEQRVFSSSSLHFSQSLQIALLINFKTISQRECDYLKEDGNSFHSNIIILFSVLE